MDHVRQNCQYYSWTLGSTHIPLNHALDIDIIHQAFNIQRCLGVGTQNHFELFASSKRSVESSLVAAHINVVFGLKRNEQTARHREHSSQSVWKSYYYYDYDYDCGGW
jgi:hypothetical protein